MTYPNLDNHFTELSQIFAEKNGIDLNDCWTPIDETQKKYAVVIKKIEKEIDNIPIIYAEKLRRIINDNAKLVEENNRLINRNKLLEELYENDERKKKANLGVQIKRRKFRESLLRKKMLRKSF